MKTWCIFLLFSLFPLFSMDAPISPQRQLILSQIAQAMNDIDQHMASFGARSFHRNEITQDEDHAVVETMKYLQKRLRKLHFLYKNLEDRDE